MKGVWEALSDKTRREILTLLRERAYTAGEICDRFALSPATVSHHLSVLKEGKLVTASRHAQTIIYSLNTTVIQEAMKSLAEFLNK